MTTLTLDRPRSTVSGTVPRYSVVRSVRVRGGDSCGMVLETPARELVELDLDCAPDPAAAEELRSIGRPLAVRMEMVPGSVHRCTVLLTTATGPQRVPTSLGSALALCAQGRHTIVTRAS